MAETEYTMEQLKKQNDILKKEISEITANSKKRENQLNEVLKFSDMLIVNTTNELRIISSYGAANAVLEESSKKLVSGADLIKIIYHTTRNLYDKDSNKDEDEDIDKKVNRFISSNKDEIQLKIVGKNESEIFLLVWDILKMENGLRNFLRIIPTNTIVQESKNYFKKQINKNKEHIKQLLNSINDGILFADLSNKIISVNDKAKEFLLSDSSKLMTRANLEGKFYYEIFTNEEQDIITKRMDLNNKVILNREKISYQMKTLGKNLNFTVLPWLNDENTVQGVIIIVSYFQNQVSKDVKEQSIDIKTLKAYLVNTLEKNKIMNERVLELENNHKWFMKQRNDDNKTIKYCHVTIKNLYSYLDSLPYPTAIMKLPDRIYDFVNKEFLIKYKLEKKEVLSKKDKDVFGPDTETFFDSIYLKNKDSKEVVEFRNVKFKGRQTIIFDNNEEKTHLIRVFEK